MKFNEILKQLIEDAEISQKQLAYDLNIGASTIGNYIRGIREPDFDTLKAIASYFNVSCDYLLDNRVGNGISFGEDRLLNIYRSLDTAEQSLLIEQGKLLIRYGIHRKNTGG